MFFLCFLVFGHGLVGKQDLRVRWASVAELVLRSSIFQITPQTSQLAAADVVATIFLTHHLRGDKVLMWSDSTGAARVGPGQAWRRQHRLLYLHNVQFGKQVAVRQGQRVAVQEPARRLRHVWVLVQLVGQRSLQVRVQLLQGRIEVLPQP